MKPIIALLLLTLANPTLAQGIMVEEITMATDAQSWARRSDRIDQAQLIEASATVSVAGRTHELSFVHTPAGTIGCWVVDGTCRPINQAHKDLPTVGVLFDLILARTAPAAQSAAQLPGSATPWPLPKSQALPWGSARFKDWHYNPEVGFPMPETITVSARQDMPGFTLRLQRFYLVPGHAAQCALPRWG